MRDLFKLICDLIGDWLSYKHRGFVQPDHPGQKNYPLINNTRDVAAQKVIDEVYQSKEKKK